MVEYNKPLPNLDADSQEFWEGCHRHELILEKCAGCNQYYFPPGPICPHCFSADVKWQKVSGRGTVYTYTVVRRALNPDWEDMVPYAVGVVELAEGPRLVTNIIGCSPEEIKIGMPVEVTFDDITENATLPKFKPAI